MSDSSAKSAAKSSLSDGDISTYARRPGPQAGSDGTDVDAHVATDVDTDAPAPTDVDTSAKTDQDFG